MAKKDETKVASLVRRAQDHPVLAWVIVISFGFSGIAAVIITFDNLLKVFHSTVEKPAPSSLVAAQPKTEAPVDKPPPVQLASPLVEKRDSTTSSRPSSLPIVQETPKPILVTSLQVKALRTVGNNRVTFSVLLKNNSDEKVRIHTIQSASFNLVPAKLTEPEGNWELGPQESLSVGTWIEVIPEAFRTIEERPATLVYSIVVSYSNRGVPTTFTIEGSPSQSSDDLNLTRREWKP